MDAVRAYSTQFHTSPDSGNGVQTYISSPEFLDSIVAKARLLGKTIGVRYGEGYISQKQLGVKHLEDLILNET